MQQTYLADRLAIADLMNGWIHRDLCEWDKLRELFHPDGVIEVTWFEGKFTDFIAGSMRMGQSDFQGKHLIGSPVVTFNGHKAIAETNAVILSENIRLGLGSMAHNRFYDLIEKRDNVWKIVKRQSIYDMASFAFPRGPVDIDAAQVQRYPREYAALAYLLEKSGFPVARVFPTKNRDLEKKIKAAGAAWLKG